MKTAATVRLAGVAALALAAGCALKTPPDAAAIKKEAMAKVVEPPAWSATGAAAGAVADGWLTSFGDEQLTAAVAEAIANLSLIHI